MPTMDELRKNIDALDLQIRELLAKRLDCSYEVARSKNDAGSMEIFRADREAAILEKLGNDVPEDRRAEYLAVVRKIMETSRMYQYGLIYEWRDDAFSSISGHQLCDTASSRIVVRLTRENHPNAMSTILSMVGDYGFNMERMELVEETPVTVTFDLTILGDITQTHMRKLIFQLSRETMGFSVLENK